MEQQTHLRHVKIDGFKSIKHLDLEMRPINILIGANGSGKTNFISLFTLLRNLSEGKLQNYVERQGFANTFFHFGSKRTPRISIDLSVGQNGYHVDFTHGVSNDSLVFEREFCTYLKSQKQWMIKGQRGESGLLSSSEAESGHVRDYTRKYMQRCWVYHFHDTSPTAGFKQAQSVQSNTRLYPDASNLAPVLRHLHDHFLPAYQEIVRAVRAVAPFFHDFYLEPQGETGNESLLLRWIHRDYEVPFSANQLSDGTARFICMAVLFLQPFFFRSGTIILDEPELGLHPAALDVLADIIKSVSNESQIICSTQSVAFANRFKPEDFIVVDQELGASVFRRLGDVELDHWLDDYGMGDIWSKNLIGGRPEW